MSGDDREVCITTHHKGLINRSDYRHDSHVVLLNNTGTGVITEYNRSVRCTKITGHTRDDSDVCSTIKHWCLIRSSDYRR